MRYLTVGMLCAVCICSCSNENEHQIPDHIRQLENITIFQTGDPPTHEIALTPEQSYGDTSEVLIGDFTDIAVDSAGRVYIADFSQKNIKVFTPDGRFITRLGREGEGPGEFRYLRTIQTTDTHLFVRDRDLDRTSLFSLDSLKLDRTIKFAPNRDKHEELREANLGNYYARPNNTSFLSFSTSTFSDDIDNWDRIEYTDHYYLLNEEGHITSEKLFQMRSSIHVLVPIGGLSVGRPIDFLGKSLTALANDGRILTVWTQEFLVKVYSPNGNYQRAFYYPYQNAQMDPRSDVDQGIVEILQGGLQFPETWPALEAMFVDDESRIWLSTIVEDQSVYEWWVLQNSGALIAKFTWPRNKSIQAIKNGNLYALETENETKLQRVVRYRVDMSER